MESAPLNKAHVFGRKAVKCHMKGLFTEAANNHKESAKLLEELSVKLPKDSPVIRSLLEQRKYHIRQAELAELAEKYISKRLPFSDKKITEMFRDLDVKQKQQDVENAAKPRMKHYDVHRKLDEADSLIGILLVGTKTKTEVPILNQSTTDYTKSNFALRPKNNSEIIEELQIVNTNLRSFVDQLLTELQDVREENKALKRELQQYKVNHIQTQENAAAAVSLQEIFEQLPVRSLPELAPLETPPEFDL